MGMKAQVWIGDFSIGLIIFIIAVILFVVYTSNIANLNERKIERLAYESRRIAADLVSAGLPIGWTPGTVRKIGLTHGDQHLSWSAFLMLKTILYDRAKFILGTDADFFVFFQDDKGKIINVVGNCGYGHPSLNIPLLPQRWAYVTPNIDYYEQMPGSTTLWENKGYFHFGVPGISDLHVYRTNIPRIFKNGTENLDGSYLFNGNKINSSELFIVNVSHPVNASHDPFDIAALDSNQYNRSDRDKIANYTYNDGNLFIFNWWCHEDNPECKDRMHYAELDANFSNTIDLNYTLPQFSRFINATVVADYYFQFPFGMMISFGDLWGDVGELNAIRALPNSSNFQPLAFFLTYANPLAPWMQHPDPNYNFLPPIPNVNSPAAFAQWQYGFGQAFFLGLNVSMLNTTSPACPYCNFNDYLDEIVWGVHRVAGHCGTLDLSSIDFDHLVPTERLIYFDGKFIKMTVYAWD